MASLYSLDPGLVPWAHALVVEAGNARLLPRVTSTRRSRAQQTRLYRAYLAGRSRFPAAPPGYSSHEYGWAFDLVVQPMDALAELGEVWRNWGGFWSRSDPIHFEGPGWPHEIPRIDPLVRDVAAEASISAAKDVVSAAVGPLGTVAEALSGFLF